MHNRDIKTAKDFLGRKQGAIPKNHNTVFNGDKNAFSYIRDVTVDSSSIDPHYSKNQRDGDLDLQYLPKIKTVIRHINSGHKIMIIMRGAPGSGKSYYAKKIIDLTLQCEYQDFIHSTDNYFYNNSNKYCYDPQSITDAHEFNQKMVLEKASIGCSPIIVDNTNTKIWEMMPYIRIGIQHGYTIEILQPNTPWCNSASMLSKKNIHGVPRKKIEYILSNFEPINNNQIIELIKKLSSHSVLHHTKFQPNIQHQLELGIENTHHNSISDDILQKVRCPYNDPLLNSYGTKDFNIECIQFSKSNITEHLKATVRNKHASKLELTNLVFDDKRCIQKHEMHVLNCPNANKSFFAIRQLFPNKNVYQLWELFVKSNGIADCVNKILLNDDNCYEVGNQNVNNLFACDCAAQNPLHKNNDIKSCEAKTTSIYDNYIESEKKKSYIQNLENMKKRQYGKSVEKQEILDIHCANYIQNTIEKLEQVNGKQEFDKTKFCTAVSDCELYEINLGQVFVKQLQNIFEFNTKSMETLTNLKTNIFMPKSLAKQVYALWMESLYNQIEEQNNLTIKEDEIFADNIALAWLQYNSNEQNTHNSIHKKLELYSHLIKLFQTFPKLQKEVIIDIYQAYGNQFDETLKVLKSVNNDSRCNKLFFFNSTKEKIYSKEAKNAALREFETSRNYAVHHSQLKAECFEKAKYAVKKNNASVAVYYSHIANFHKTKIDICNQKAANFIMEVNDWKQTNPDFIDLHYLHAMEAIQCLDIFLDKNISKLKNISRTFKYIFIITGRGLHSVGGISTIKNRVKTRLRDRNLKWTEVNPGLLKVKIFSSSKFSKNC